MKKFINILSCLIVAMVAMSCGSKVEKDIKVLVGDEFKVVDVKSVDIQKDFYLYTNEYSEVSEKHDAACDEAMEWTSLVARCKVLMDTYTDSQFEVLYKENKASLDSVTAKRNEYYETMQMLKENQKKGKLYVAKLKGKNEYTGKYLDFNSYQIFSYDSDGSLHQVDTDNTIQIVCSVYPNAKKDMQKAMGMVGEMMLDALSNIDF
jgi:tRNA(Leu) C34 or U34 (ribose-2'-O)-methylase TrmL